MNKKRMLLITCAVIFIGLAVNVVAMTNASRSSVSVIGGADGPTAIVVR